jgi:hypothetical protein
MSKHKLEEILKAYKNKSINFEVVMAELDKNGFCPNLLHDDAGRWAVAFDGYQTLNATKKAIDIQTSFFIEKKYWKRSIRGALIFALETDLIKDRV